MSQSTVTKSSIEAYLYMCDNPQADENTKDAVWEIQSFITGFSLQKNNNKRTIYNKRTKVGAKPGIDEKTGSITQMYIARNKGIFKAYDEGKPIALRIDIVDSEGDYAGKVTEQIYIKGVDLINLNMDYGNLNDDSDINGSCDFTFESDHAVVVDPDAQI